MTPFGTWAKASGPLLLPQNLTTHEISICVPAVAEDDRYNSGFRLSGCTAYRWSVTRSGMLVKRHQSHISWCRVDRKFTGLFEKVTAIALLDRLLKIAVACRLVIFIRFQFYLRIVSLWLASFIPVPDNRSTRKHRLGPHIYVLTR